MFGSVAQKYYIVLLSCCLLFTSCSPANPSPQSPLSASSDLVIYTALEEALWRPLIKEFEERTNYHVTVIQGSSDTFIPQLSAQTASTPEWDLVFGADACLLEQSTRFFLPYEGIETTWLMKDFSPAHRLWTPFCVSPLVILYNTRLVTYKEVPYGWDSLLEERWLGRIALDAPSAANFSLDGLAAARHLSAHGPDYMDLFLANTGDILPRGSSCAAAVVEGRSSLCMTDERLALHLKKEDSGVDFLYPREGTCALVTGSAILQDCPHPIAAEDFLDFTLKKDTQRLLSDCLCLRPVRSDVGSPDDTPSLSRLGLIPFSAHDWLAEKQTLLSQWSKLSSKGGHTP